MNAFGYLIVIGAVLICFVGFKIRQTDPSFERDIKIYSRSNLIETHLNEFKDIIVFVAATKLKLVFYDVPKKPLKTS